MSQTYNPLNRYDYDTIDEFNGNMTIAEIESKLDSIPSSITDTYSKSEIDTALSTKADKTDLTALSTKIDSKADLTALDAKADKTSLDLYQTKAMAEADKSSLNDAIALKANIADVNALLLAKADKTTVDTLAASIDGKANKGDSYTKAESDTALAAKADATAVTSIDSALALKANIADVYSKTETSSKSEIDSALALKANIADMTTEIAKLETITDANTSHTTLQANIDAVNTKIDGIKIVGSNGTGDISKVYTLVDKDGNKLGDEIDVMKDKFLKSVAYNETSHILTFTFEVETGETSTTVDLSNLVDVSTGANVKLDGFSKGTVSNDVVADDNVNTAVSKLENKIDLKANISDVYSKSEIDTTLQTYATNNSVDGKLGTVQASIDNEVTRAEGAEKSAKTEVVAGNGVVITSAISETDSHSIYTITADLSTVYLKNETSSKTELDAVFATKADKTDVAAKADATALTAFTTTEQLALKADATALTAYATTAQLADKADASALTAYATTVQLDSKADATALTAYATTAQLANKADSTALTTYITSNNTALALKANSADVYAKTETSSKSEIDTALAVKANASDVYTKTEIDNKLTNNYVSNETFTASTGSLNSSITALNATVTGSYETKSDATAMHDVLNAAITANTKSITDLTTLSNSNDKNLAIGAGLSTGDTEQSIELGKYIVNATSTIISAATSLNDADVKLDGKIAEVITKLNTLVNSIKNAETFDALKTAIAGLNF